MLSLGTPIGPYDLQIAAIALANDCTVVTHNTAEFQRVPRTDRRRLAEPAMIERTSKTGQTDEIQGMLKEVLA